MTTAVAAGPPKDDERSVRVLGAPYSIGRIRCVVDLDAVVDIAGYARVNGREIAVHHLDAAAYRAIQQLQASPATFDVHTLYDAAERACPELTREEIDRLSGPKVGALLAVAEGGIKEAQIPTGGETAATDATGSTPGGAHG